MSFISLHDRNHSAGPTPKYTGGQTGTPRSRSKVKNVNLSTQHFRLAHQRVSLDVDLAHKKINGFTELTLIPTSNQLRAVKLDAREMNIKEVYVNGTKLVNFIHKDMLYINDPEKFESCTSAKLVNIWDLYSEKFTINQHHLLRRKLNYIFGEFEEDEYDANNTFDLGSTEELIISLPDNFKHQSADRHAAHTPASSIPTDLTPLHSRNKNTHGDTYAPIQIGIEYELINPNNGVNFSCFGEDRKLWHAYTVNSEYNVSTSSWVPCVDNLWEKGTWSFELTVPRSTKDIDNFSSFENGSLNDSKEDEVETKHSSSKGIPVDHNESDDDEDDAEHFDLFVCTGDTNNVKETPHPTDKSKKVVSWSIFNPICAHHVGWAIGPFESSELANLNSNSSQPSGEDEMEEIEKDELGSVVTLYFLPGQEELARNTCIFVHEALNFFSSEFGSYPFSSYGIVFVSGPSHPYNNFAGLTVLSDRLLYPQNLIEPIFTLTEEILECIAGQWSSINIVPQTFHDLWCTIGIARFMSFQFLKNLMGTNEFRYKIKQKMEKIVETDVSKQPISLPYLRFPLSEADLDFVRLKSSVILLILDRRMTKTDKSFGLSRVLPKIFLQAMSGDLQNGTLSTQHFQNVCEKVNRNRLDNFFKQWVFGVGTPVFNITQRFNKKRSLIEVVIRQTQVQQHKTIRPKPENFMEEAMHYLHDQELPSAQTTFMGPMTIRVHEADGTPYEHIVDIKDSLVKFDVQYNTKARRSRKHKEENVEANPVFSKLGDILKKDKDMKEWDLEEWPKRDEDLVDPYEWIRLDTDTEWIAKFNVRQPDYMFCSQLQHDRDVEAQCDAARYFGEQEKPNKIYCTTLTRTLMDRRYHYGVRIAAARALADLSKQSNSYFGLKYLLKAFRKLFCFENSSIPRANSFEQFERYFLQRAFPRILAQVRDDEGNTLPEIKEILLNFVKYNDNSNNEFQDCYYVSDLLGALTEATIPINEKKKVIDFHLEKEKRLGYESSDQQFVDQVVEELDRLCKIEEWVPSYQNIIYASCIRQKAKLARNNLCEYSFEEFAKFTTPKNPIEIRLAAFESILVLGGIKVWEVLRYFLHSLCLSSSTSSFRTRMIDALKNAVCEAAIHGLPSDIDDPEFDSLDKLFNSRKGHSNPNGMVVVEESQNPEISSRRDALARASIEGAILLLRRDYGIGLGLKKVFWRLIHTSLLGLRERRILFGLCELLFFEKDTYPVDIPVPYVPLEELKKKIVAKELDNCQVIIKREGRFRIQLSTKISLSDGRRAEKPGRAVSEHGKRGSSSTFDNKAPEPKLKLRLGRSETKGPEAEQHPIVTRNGKNNMSIKMKFLRRNLSDVTTSRRRRRNVLLSDSSVTLKFFSPDNIKKLKNPPKINTVADESVNDIPTTARGDLSVIKGPTRFVKIKSGMVSLSETPFTSDQREDMTSQQPKQNHSMNESETPQTVKETVAEPIKRDISHAPNKLTPRVTSREGSAEPPWSRATSPGDGENHGTKKKKTKIYIHDGSRSQSRSTSSSVEPEEKKEPAESRDEKNNEQEQKEAPKSKPKLSLKLSLK
ncbi:hypothetical protein CJI97_001684 [Candidozyma auris]|nr:hypothetical protein CJI97_001684 [[Candida] auris]